MCADVLHTGTQTGTCLCCTLRAHSSLTHTRAFAHMEKELPGYARPQGHVLFVGSETRHVACAWPGPGKPSGVKNAFPGGRCEDLGGHPHVHTHDTHTHVHTRTRRCVCTRSRGELRRAGQLLSAAGGHPHPAPPPRRRLLYLNHDSIGIIVFETDNWLLCISPVLHVCGFNN